MDKTLVPAYLRSNRDLIRNLGKQADYGAVNPRYYAPELLSLNSSLRKIARDFPIGSQIFREDILDLIAKRRIYDACVLTMVWGGMSLIPKIKGELTSTPFAKFIRIPEHVVELSWERIIDGIRNEEWDVLFADFEPDGGYKLEGVGLSFFTKLFFFAGWSLDEIQIKPLILDKWTCTAYCALLLEAGQLEKTNELFRGYNKDYGAQPRFGSSRSRLYRYFIEDMNEWSLALDVTPDKLEQFIFGWSKKVKKPNNPRDHFEGVCEEYF